MNSMKSRSISSPNVVARSWRGGSMIRLQDRVCRWLATARTRDAYMPRNRLYTAFPSRPGHQCFRLRPGCTCLTATEDTGLLHDDPRSLDTRPTSSYPLESFAKGAPPRVCQPEYSCS